MESAVISTFSALAGSLIGGFTGIATTWLTQRGQFISEKMVRETARREALNAEFMTETSRLLVDGLEHESQELGQFVNIFAQIGRMRLISSPEVVAQAEKTSAVYSGCLFGTQHESRRNERARLQR